MDYLHLALIAKNETQLDELVRYYRLVGVDHITIYDNESKASVAEQLREHVDSGYVTVRLVHGRGMQNKVYFQSCRESSSKCLWLACFDADEFLVPKLSENLPTLLGEFEKYPGVGFNWQVFGPNGYLTRPDLPQIIAYTTRLPHAANSYHQHIKSVVQPKQVKAWPNPHYALYHQGSCVNENHQPVSGPFSLPVSVAKAQLNHYHTRSLEDWKIKLDRGSPAGGHARIANFDDLWKQAVIEDFSIQRFAQKLYPSLGGGH